MANNKQRYDVCASQWVVMICWVAMCMVGTSIATAQESTVAAEDAALLQPFVSDTTFLILKVNPSEIGLPDMEQALGALSPASKTAQQEFTRQVNEGLERLKSLLNNQAIYVTVGIPNSKTHKPTFVFARKMDGAIAQDLIDVLKGQFNSEPHIMGEHIVMSPGQNVEKVKSLFRDFPSSPRPEIEHALKAVSEYPAQALLLPPPHVWRTFNELSLELPTQLGGGSTRVLTEGLQWAALGIDPGKARAMLVIQSESADAARDLAAHLPTMLRAAYDAAPQIHKQVPPELAQALTSWLKPQVDGKRITIHLDGLEKTAANLKLFAAIGQRLQERTRRRTNVQRFKQLLLAMHNYHDTYSSFPPHDKHRGKDGKQHLSWRVHILPYVEEPQLYNEFHLDEPWDSPHNKKLIGKMPDVYSTHSFIITAKALIRPGYTTFLAPVGERTVFGGDKSTLFRMITDGTSNTVAVVEVEPRKAVPWTAPDDFAFDPKNPVDGLLVGADGLWLAAFCDGSVRQLKADLRPESILHLFQMSDGNRIYQNERR